MMSLDVMFLKKYKGDATVAFYSLAVKLMTVLSIVIVTVNITISTKIAECFSSNSNLELNRMLKNSSRLIFILTFPLVVFIVVFSEKILRFFGNDYVAAQQALLILIIGQGICSAFGSASVYLNMTGRQHIFKGILLASVVMNFVLNRFLIPEFGMSGAAIAFVVSSFFWNVLASVIIYHKDKVKVFLN
jgi:O-antigen/teichoic acid export membrane protein